jgi:hypothetical protein
LFVGGCVRRRREGTWDADRKRASQGKVYGIEVDLGHPTVESDSFAREREGEGELSRVRLSSGSPTQSVQHLGRPQPFQLAPERDEGRAGFPGRAIHKQHPFTPPTHPAGL